MKKYKFVLLLLTLISLFTYPIAVSAQNLRFTVPAAEVEVYLEEDGSASCWYYYEYQNDPSADAIDFIDVGMPSPSYSRDSIEAEIDGVVIKNIESSPYVANGFALNLAENAIQPGQSGVVTIWIPGVTNVLTPFDEGDRQDYVDFQFSPNFFSSDFDKSTNTEYRVTIILPPGVGNEEGVYFNPVNWPGTSEPSEIGRTAEGDRVYYSWFTNNGDAHTQYNFGAAFPQGYVPEEVIVTQVEVDEPVGSPSTPGFINSIFNFLGGSTCFCGFGVVFFIFMISILFQIIKGGSKRKMAYLPPKMKIEGNGIKRGLTAVEAAILMEQPMDKVMTMILFGILKKEAALVLQSDPLEIEVNDPLPEGLHPYEEEFLEAFKSPKNERRSALQKMMVNLVKSVSNKMKGFSRKETLAYYKDIMERAWKMVEDAATPEVKSEHYNQTMEWTMLDDQYEDRTRRVFTGGPVFVPMWWPRYSPTYRRSIGGGTSQPVPTSVKPSVSGGGGRVSLPHIPGSDFAASVINGSSAMAAGVIGNLTSFTSGVTNRPNPIPVSTRSGGGGFRGGGGSSCACACACAGGACACAGGGR